MRKIPFKLRPQVGPAHLLLQEASSYEDAGKDQDHKYFRAHGEVFEASSARADSRFYDDPRSVVRYVASEPGGVSGCASPGAGRTSATTRATSSRAVAAVGSTRCAISGFAGGADPGCFHVSRASRRGRQMGARAS